jgi:two-component system chemotaxis sensor kinase CheA
VAASTVGAPAGIASEVAAPEVAKPAVSVAVELPTRGPERTPPAVTAELVSTEPAVAAPAGVVRVDTLKLDSLIDLVGELVVAQSQVVQSQELKGIANEHLVRSLSQLRSITSDLQRTAMSLRMVPIRGTFRKMTRLVRDLAGDLGHATLATGFENDAAVSDESHREAGQAEQGDDEVEIIHKIERRSVQ